MKKFNIKPEEALFISDACGELKGAKRIGLLTVGLNCDGGDHSIRRIGEILKILKSLNHP